MLASWVDPTTALLLGAAVGSLLGFIAGIAVALNIPHNENDDPSFLDTES